MKRLLLKLRNEIAAGNPAVLVTIISLSGSAPRGVGTTMAVLSSGEQIGTIGGGTLEHRARQRAMALEKHAQDETIAFEIHPSKAENTGEASGCVTVLFRRFHGETALHMLDEALHAIETDESAYFVCPIQISTAGKTRVVSSDALMQQFRLNRLPEHPVLFSGDPDWFIEPLFNLPRVLLFGGGHVAQKTAAQLALLEYRVWVVEERAAFADAKLFPTAERILCVPFDAAQSLLTVSNRDHAIVMTSAHETDFAVLNWLLRTSADYIGCIGSKRKVRSARERLIANGMSEQALDRLHSPIGLAIGAETPAEIAVSIAAELIAYMRNKDAT